MSGTLKTEQVLFLAGFDCINVDVLVMKGLAARVAISASSPSSQSHFP